MSISRNKRNITIDVEPFMRIFEITNEKYDIIKFKDVHKRQDLEFC